MSLFTFAEDAEGLKGMATFALGGNIKLPEEEEG